MSWQKEPNPFSFYTGLHNDATELVKNAIILFIKELNEIEKIYPCCGMSDTAARESIANIVSQEIYDNL